MARTCSIHQVQRYQVFFNIGCINRRDEFIAYPRNLALSILPRRYLHTRQSFCIGGIGWGFYIIIELSVSLYEVETSLVDETDDRKVHTY